MSDDDLDALRSALNATPAPDPARKTADLSAAMAAFEEIHAPRQETTTLPRPSLDRPIWGRLMQGAKRMFQTLTTKAALTVTTGIVTAGLAVAVFLPMQQLGAPSDLNIGRPIQETVEPTDGVQVTDEVQNATENGKLHSDTLYDLAPEEDRSRLSFGASTSEALEPQSRAGQSAPQPLARTTVEDAPAPAPRLFQEPFSQDGEALSDGDQLSEAPFVGPEADTEAFANAAENPLKVVAEDPVSTFSVDVDTASYAVVRQSLMAGRLPPAEAVRVEEMVNYFPYDSPGPEAGSAPFQPTVTVTDTPWKEGTQLVHIALQGEMPLVDERPPLNLVFLIDTSGSMADANKLPLLKQSFRLMLGELRPEDQVAIVTYAGSAGQVLAPTPASERSKILTALDQLQSGGGTAGQAGLQQAYSVAEGMAEDGEVTRVLLATDGDFNVGLSDTEQLEKFIADKRDSGTYLSVLGFGRGNLDDATMQALAQNGNGQAAYIDTLNEARKVLVDQLTGALFPIASDVKVQIEFNPAQIAEYRLIGYETRALRRQDFDNDKIDAGDIGAGHRVTAIYEVTSVGSPARQTGPLRYGDAEAVAETSAELGFLRLRWKEPGADESQLIEAPIAMNQGEATTETKFATAIAGFGQLLRDSTQLGNWDYRDAIALATEGRGADPFGYRTEAINLMRLAESLSKSRN